MYELDSVDQILYRAHLNEICKAVWVLCAGLEKNLNPGRGPLLLVFVNDFVGVPLAWTLAVWASELQKLLAQ